MKKRSKNIIAIVLALVIIGTGAFSYFYINDYYRAEDVMAYLQTDTAVKVNKTDFGYFFDGAGNEQALIFYPGAKVECEAYAPLLKTIAGKGLDCFLIDMPLRFAFFGINKAEEVMAHYTYQNWYLAGHSLGGAMACYFADTHRETLSGLYLLAAYSSKDLSDVRFPVTVVYGSNDKVVNREKIKAGRALMPTAYAEAVIDGGNHAYFASYGEQKGDGTATITRLQQWKKTAEIITADLVLSR